MFMQIFSKQKRQESSEEQSDNSDAHCELGEVKSQFHPRYEALSPQTAVDEQTAEQDFSRANVEYSPRGPFKAFEFEVERIVPELEYYRFNVKLGHFKLLLSSVKLDQQSLFNEHEVKGNFGKIYSFDFLGEQICIKSLPYSSEGDLEVKLAKAVKQLSILKICSILRCSPHVSNYFGFDILIYSDCIQFAMEKGQEKSMASPLQRQQLRKQLKLMHHFKIIHFDIKPENIVFSKHFNKHVFIDFGFSEIVKERCGLKTLTTFRGTPNFSTEEIIALMWVKQGYADLYYNDIFALNGSLVQKPKNIYQLASQELIYCQQTKKPLRVIFFPNIYSAFLFLVFQFYYVNADQLMSNQFADHCLSNDKNSIKKILSFVESCLKYIFLQRFFFETLKPYQNLAQYSQIKEKIKINKSIIFFKLNYSYEPFKTIKNLIDEQSYFESRLSAILGAEELDDQFTPFVASAFQCVRFDRRNLQLKDKLQIAKKMKTLLPAHLYASLGEDGQKEIQDLIALTKAVYRHCLSSAPSRQIRELIFKVFQHFVLFDIEYSQLFGKLREFIGRNGSHFEAYEVIVELSRLLNLIKLIQTSHVANITVCYEQIKSLLRQRMHQFKFDSNVKSNKQAISIRPIILFCNQAISINHEQIQSIHFQLKKIKSSAIRNHLFCLFINRLLKNSNLKNLNELMLIINYAKSISQYDIWNYMWINYQIINKTNNLSWIAHLRSQASTVINCSCLFNKLRINQYVGYLSFNDALNFIQRYPLVCKISHKIDKKFLAVIWQIYFSKPEEDQLRELLPQLYQVYYDNRKCRKYISNNNLRYQLKFQQSCIEYYFFLLSPQTRKLFMEELLQSETLFATLKQQSEAFIKYDYHLYQTQKYKLTQNPQLCLQHLHKLKQVVPNQCIDLKLQIFKETINMGLRLSHNYVSKSIKELYHYCQVSNLLSSYLIPFNQIYLYETFRVLTKENETSTRKFLIYLANILTLNPFQDYFNTLSNSLDIFMAAEINNRNIISYDNFCFEHVCDFARNPYILIFLIYSLPEVNNEPKIQMLKTFAKNCHYLANFAKRKLLGKYYSSFSIALQQKSKRKRRFVFRQAKNFMFVRYNSFSPKRLLKPSKKVKQERGQVWKILTRKIKKFENILKQ